MNFLTLVPVLGNLLNRIVNDADGRFFEKVPTVTKKGCLPHQQGGEMAKLCLLRCRYKDNPDTQNNLINWTTLIILTRQLSQFDAKINDKYNINSIHTDVIMYAYVNELNTLVIIYYN